MTEDLLQVLLSANAHDRVIKAIVEALGDSAPEEFANSVRLLDRRVHGKLRATADIASETIGELKTKDKNKPRKKLERIARRIIQRAAEELLATKATQESGGMWQTTMAAVALDIIRAHGAVDVLDEWAAQERNRTETGRKIAHKTIAAKNSARNSEILVEAAKKSSEPERKNAARAALRLNLKGDSKATPAAARGVIQREKSRKK